MSSIGGEDQCGNGTNPRILDRGARGARVENNLEPHIEPTRKHVVDDIHDLTYPRSARIIARHRSDGRADWRWRISRARAKDCILRRARISERKIIIRARVLR